MSDVKQINEKDKFKILLEAAQLINSTLNINEVLNLFMDKVIDILRAERGIIMLVDDETEELTLKTARNMDKQTIDSSEFSVSLSSIKSVAKSEIPLICPNTQLDPKLSKRASINLHSIRYILCYPMKVKAKTIGVIYVDNRISAGIFDERHGELLEGLANQAAIAVENAKLYESLEKRYMDVIRALANAIEAKNPYTKGHSDRVTLLAVKTARAMELPEKELKEVEMAGILHDVGKIGIEERVLNKPGKLTDEEFEKMKEHAEKGSNILESIDLPQSVKDAVLYHQEKFDGTGYPDGLKENTIPLYARIIAVCDAFDAMTTDRVYRKSLGKEWAIEELKKCSGRQFDPNIIEKFIEHKVYDSI